MSGQSEQKESQMKVAAISIVLTFTMTAIGSYITYEFIDSRKERDKFQFESRKKLFDESEIAIKSVKKSYSGVALLFAEEYAITPEKLSKVHDNFRISIQGYQEYLTKLQRLGDSNQINVAKKILEWAWRDYTEIDLQLKMSKSAVNCAESLLLIEDVDSEHFKFVKDALNSDLENLIKNENSIFYALSNYNRPVISKLELNLAWQFRQSLGLEATPDIAEAVNELQNASERSNNFQYKEKDRPFVVAEMREMLSESFTSSGDDEFQDEKNKYCHEASVLKFIDYAIKNSVYLGNELEK